MTDNEKMNDVIKPIWIGIDIYFLNYHNNATTISLQEFNLYVATLVIQTHKICPKMGIAVIALLVVIQSKNKKE